MNTRCQTLIEPHRAFNTVQRATILTLLLGQLLLLLPIKTLAHSGDLDPTFGSGGKLRIHFTEYVGERAEAVLIQSDGKILLGGGSNYGDAVARFNTNGTLDETFGSDGKLWQGYHGFPANMVLAGDDKFITVGGFWIDGASKEYFYVRRYNGNG